MKYVICDDLNYFIVNHYLKNAFKVKNDVESDQLWYLTVDEETSKERNSVIFSIYRYEDTKDYKWKLYSGCERINVENVCIREKNVLNELFEDAYILLDTQWGPKEGIEKSKIKEKIIEWCQNNAGKYRKVFVYTAHGIGDAQNLVTELERKNICVHFEPKSIKPTPGIEQQDDFEKFFDTIKYFSDLDN